MNGLKLTYSRKEAAHQLSVTTRCLDHWISRGVIKARKLGSKKVIIPGSELKRVIDQGIPGRGE
jgi:excisionase family DNA binding protein